MSDNLHVSVSSDGKMCQQGVLWKAIASYPGRSSKNKTKKPACYPLFVHMRQSQHTCVKLLLWHCTLVYVHLLNTSGSSMGRRLGTDLSFSLVFLHLLVTHLHYPL